MTADQIERAYGKHGPDSHRRWAEGQALIEQQRRRASATQSAVAVRSECVAALDVLEALVAQSITSDDRRRA